MRTTVLLIVASLGFAAACAHDPNDTSLTPAEKARLIEAERARAAVAEDGQSAITPRAGCSSSNALSRFNARGTGDGFDSGGCNAVGK